MFQRVEPQHGGAAALAVLIPHGAKTLVILRPRAWAFDLLPARWEHGRVPEFCDFTRDEAAHVARRLIAALEAAAGGDNPVQTFGAADRECFQIWLRAADFVWIACRRAPGQAYQPLILSTRHEAIALAEQLTAFVWPQGDTHQQYYFNTQNLS